MARVPGDVIVLLEARGHWVVMNVFARTCLGGGSEVLELMSVIETLGETNLLARYRNKTFRVWEIEWFSNYDGSLADPTRYIRNPTQWPTVEELDIVSLIERLKQHFLLIDDDAAYRARFAPKTSLLDREHFGNFHQQLGQELLLVHRESPAKWWMHQKFNDDLQSVRNNLYGAIQAHYLEGYFRRRFSPGDVVVDIGCGTGFYSNMMAKTGASVLGVDPSEEYIQLARENAIEGTRFEVMQVSCEGAMDQIPTGYADYVFMSDALLFYFVPMASNQVADLQVLFNDVRRILKPNGLFISMEPHYIFWLLPWLGDVDRPFTVLTEYLHRTFSVTTSISKLVQAYARGGFVITWMEELTPVPAFEPVDPRAYHFARQFPLWQLFEMRKA